MLSLILIISHLLNILKDHILSLIRPKKKKIFGIHNPLGLRYLFQLRVGLSLLRYHKKCHNFIDTPSGICLCDHGIEDTNHFLFLCPFFALHRATLASSVIQILQKYNLNHLANQPQLYLYGHPTINFADNRKIILSTIKYITETRRFFNVRMLPDSRPSPETNLWFFATTSITSFFSFIALYVCESCFKLFFILLLCFYVCNFLDCHGFG